MLNPLPCPRRPWCCWTVSLLFRYFLLLCVCLCTYWCACLRVRVRVFVRVCAMYCVLLEIEMLCPLSRQPCSPVAQLLKVVVWGVPLARVGRLFCALAAAAWVTGLSLTGILPRRQPSVACRGGGGSTHFIKAREASSPGKGCAKKVTRRLGAMPKRSSSPLRSGTEGWAGEQYVRAACQ